MKRYMLGLASPATWAAAVAAIALLGCAGGETPAPRCGNGTVESGEQCDDGNTSGGDGCGPTCQGESQTECGDGFREAGEECDDGNTRDGDGCSATCEREEQVDACGDGDVTGTEECDDNNTDPCDGCSATCRIEGCGNDRRECDEECDDGNTRDGDGCSAGCELEEAACGNGIREGDEECDDGNTEGGDGCSPTCTEEATGPRCGDGVVNAAGEECDDGGNVPGDGCDATCHIEPGVCGDGDLNTGEECDDGNTAPGDGCDADCKIESAGRCGDGVVASTEQCDDGNNTSCDGCSEVCIREECGNGRMECTEECDDDNTLGGDGCSATCTIEGTGPVCGNGTIETGEECDDGNTDSGDGCDATCHVEATGLCTPDWELYCGDVDTYDTRWVGATNNVAAYACSGWEETGPEYAYAFIATTASDVTVSLSGMTADLDIFVLTAGAADVCDPANCVAYGDGTATFTSVPGTTYYLVVDGYSGAVGPFSLTLGCGVCGDGNVDPDEECDDGDTTGGDGCSAGCLLEGCGNGTLDVGEECDDGNDFSCDGCSESCQEEACGNLRLDCGEECDDGDAAAGGGCSATCQVESGACVGDWELECGNTDAYATTYSGSTDGIDWYACPQLVHWNESGREYAYSFVAPQTGSVTVTLSGLASGVDLDVFVIAQASGGCASDECVAYGDTLATFQATAGTTYYFIVDGYGGDEGAYELTVSCAGGACGDGVVNAGEDCDDGGTAPGDGCSATCQLEVCGDGVLNGGEECDDGNATAGDGCSPDCTLEAGECVPDFVLGCGGSDDYNNGNAGSTDQIDRYSCVSWDESGPEYTYSFAAPYACQVTAALTYDTSAIDLDVFVIADVGGHCDPTADCIAYGADTVTFAADAGARYFLVVDGFMGDTGDYSLSVTCDAGTCGDNTLDAGEECDDGDTSGGDGCSATCTLEGGSCAADWELSCSSPHDTYSTAAANSTDAVNGYNNGVCGSWNESGREYTYYFTAPADGTYSVTLTPDGSTDLDVFVLDESGFGCAAGNCAAYGETTASFAAVAGQTYYVVVDGFNGAEGLYDIDLTCP